MEAAGVSVRETRVHAPPSGTVAFLFTDIEGSTVRWERNQAAMQLAVRYHDEVMRAAVEAHHGHVFKTIGDAFCAAFWRAEDGLNAALQAQRALAEADFSAVDGLRVRMALHVGTSDERDGDYFGPTLNRVARLLAIGHGAQILLSGAAAELAAATLPAGCTLGDLGEHRLKDLTTPEHVFQLVANGLIGEFPKLRSLSVFDNNLPLQISSFIGRDEELAEIETLLEGARLVTLFGSGGLGKTRCALQIGANLLERFGDGVWFVELAPLADPALVPNEIAAVLGVQESANRPMLQTLVAFLEKKQALILLDNCEHLIAAAAATAAALLRACPKIKIVATSREALKITGESVYQMPPLDLPEGAGEIKPEAARRSCAVVLFADRARGASGRFSLSDDNAPIVADICRRLDGIPLAIELAAARMNVLTPRQLARQLDERFRVLRGGDRTALPRQQTMRALIDWSYDLLSEREQRLFRDFSIFAGSFSMDLATAVCASETIEEFDVLDGLFSLIDKSLVLADPSESDTRCRLLESMREYGREKSVESGEAELVAGRHAAAYADLAEHLERDYESVGYRPWLARAQSELENIRAALAWSFGPKGELLVGQRLAATLRRLMVAFAAAEARRWVGTALASVQPSTPPPTLARLELAEATLASSLSQFRAASTAADRALALFERLDDALGIAAAQRWAGRSLVYLGDVAGGEKLLRESLEALSALGFTRVGGILRDLAAACGLKGDVVGARTLFAQALASYKGSDDEYNIAVTAGTLAEAEFRCGDAEAAVVAAQEGFAAACSLNLDSRVIAWILSNLAAFLVELGRYDEARERARHALQLGREAQLEIDVVFALQHLAATAALRPPAADAGTEDRQRAATLIGFVDARLATLEVAREYTEQYLYDNILSALRVDLQAEALAELIAAGRSLNEDRAVAEALLI